MSNVQPQKRSGQSRFEYMVIISINAIVIISALTATGAQGPFLGHFEVPTNNRYIPVHVTDNHIITGTGGYFISAIDRKSGAITWTTTHSTWLEGTTVDNDTSTVYLTNESYITALDLATGKTKFTAKLPANAKEETRKIGPLITRQGPYLIASEQSNVACYDAQRGTLIWNWKATFPADISHQSRFSFETTVQNIYVNTDAAVICLDLAKGTQKWRRAKIITRGLSATKPPVLVARHHKTDALYGLSPKGKCLWRYHPHSSGTSPNITRSTASRRDILLIYSQAAKAHLHSLDANTGALKWTYGPFSGDRHPRFDNLDKLYSSRPVADESHAYFYDSDAMLHQVDLDTGVGTPIASFEDIATAYRYSWFTGHFPCRYKDTGTPEADIALKSEVLYLSSGYACHAYDIKKGAILWTTPFY